MKMKDKSIIDRESERLVREENDSLAIELETDDQSSLDIIWLFKLIISTNIILLIYIIFITFQI